MLNLGIHALWIHGHCLREGTANPCEPPKRHHTRVVLPKKAPGSIAWDFGANRPM